MPIIRLLRYSSLFPTGSQWSLQPQATMQNITRSVFKRGVIHEAFCPYIRKLAPFFDRYFRNWMVIFYQSKTELYRTYLFMDQSEWTTRAPLTKLLGTHVDQHLCWDENIKQVSSSCYATVAVLKKLKKILPFKIRKTLVQALVPSKLYFSGIVYHNLPNYLDNRLQRIRKASASFVLGHYAITDDITKLKWLVHSPAWPSYLKVYIIKHMRTLRSSSGISLVTPIESGTFQYEAAKLFNKLVRNCWDFSTFPKATFNYLMERINKTWLYIAELYFHSYMDKFFRGGGGIYHIVFRIVSFVNS